MANVNEPNLGLAFGWEFGETPWNDGMDANLVVLGGMAALSVKSRTLTTQPSASDGDVYFVPAGSIGVDWTGQSNKIAIYSSESTYDSNNTPSVLGWQFVSIRNGWNFTVQDESNLMVTWDGSGFNNTFDTTGFLTDQSSYNSTGDVEFSGKVTFTGTHTSDTNELATIQDVNTAIADQQPVNYIPSDLTGQVGKFLKVNALETGYELTAAIDSFIGLEDTPNGYPQQSGAFVLKATSNGIVFDTNSAADIGVQLDGVDVGTTSNLNFSGASVAAVFNPVTGAIDIDITGSSALTVEQVADQAYTVEESDSGKILDFTFDSGPIALTVPDSLSKDHNFLALQSGGNIVWGGAATIINVDSHTESRGLGSVLSFISPVAGTFYVNGATS